MKNLRFTILIVIVLSIISTHRVDAQNKNAIQSPGYQYEKPADGVVRILTFNVRNGRGMDDRTDYDRVANVIFAIHPEVVALQELDSVTIRSNGVDVLKAIAEKCEMNYFYGASIPYQGGKYGIGILSKETPLKTTFFPLPGTEEKRGLLMAEFKEYIFFCSHFSLTEADRVASVQLINKKGTEPVSYTHLTLPTKR